MITEALKEIEWLREEVKEFDKLMILLQRCRSLDPSDPAFAEKSNKIKLDLSEIQKNSNILSPR